MANKSNGKNERIIPFKNLKERRIQKDNISNFDKSFFKEVYEQAAELTNVIVRTSTERMKNSAYNIPLQQTLDMQNVIAFSGRRGTGKTSAMLAFSDALASGKYSRKDDEKSNGKYPNLDDKLFFPIQYVDSSVVGKNEDFFEILLFRMLQLLKSVVEDKNRNSYFAYNAQLNSLKENIATIYNHYTGLKHGSSFDSSSSYTVMEKNIEKHDVRREIKKLVSSYTEFLTKLIQQDYDGTSYKNRGFLVICIDDIDMTRKNHVEILQCIYEYFMIPGVIVMVTLNFPVIYANLKKEFYETMRITDSDDAVEKLLKISNEQTYDFMLKIIPSDMRITMPSWKKLDYRKLSETRVSFEDLEEKNIVDLFPELKDCAISKALSHQKELITPKKLIMILLADRTKVCLDLEGYKIHFMEPVSLRNLCDLFYLLYEMKNLYKYNKETEDGKEAYHKALEYNRRILLNYLYFKIIPEFNFNYEVDNFFNDFPTEPMHRRGRRICDYFYNQFAKKESDIKSLYEDPFFSNQRELYKAENYSFGEIFRCLYIGSRLNIWDKNFVKAVLASYAFSLPQYVEIEKRERRDSDATKSKQTKIEIKDMYQYRNLRDVFGYSLLGSWKKDLFKCLDKSINISADVSIAINRKYFLSAKGKKGNELRRQLYKLLLLSTISSKEVIKVDNDETESDIIIHAKLDPTAFALGSLRAFRLNSLQFRIKDDESHKGVASLIPILIKNKRKNFSYEIDEFVNEIYNNPNDIIWFILKHTDITYNSIKRTVCKFIYATDGNLNVKYHGINSAFLLFKEFYILFFDNLCKDLVEYTETSAFEDFLKHMKRDKKDIYDQLVTNNNKDDRVKVLKKYCISTLQMVKMFADEKENIQKNTNIRIEWVKTDSESEEKVKVEEVKDETT